jgi:hypothetical protein
MSTVFLTLMWISFSTMAGGGVLGKGSGIARGTTVQDGATIEVSHLFTDRCRPVGGMTIGSIVGRVISGTKSQYPTEKSKGPGATGKNTKPGKSKIIGVSRN